MFEDASGVFYTVSELTYRIKEILEFESDLQDILIQGEVSNCTLHGSGHAYFTLKDEDCQISCVMFRVAHLPQARELIRQGNKLLVKGNVSVYQQRGNYQVLVSEVRSAGVGDLYRRFLLLKDKLQTEGLFDEIHKRPLPPYPQRIAVITSPTGAVIRDILQSVQRRFPCVEIILIPALVQGEGGAASVLAGVQQAQYLADVDLLIIARGGGSIEDLWCFNDESLARAVFASRIPVVSAIGHETDFTILDFVADLRAATPTAAAELATPDREELLAALKGTAMTLTTHVQYNYYNKLQLLDDLTEKLSLQRDFLFQNEHGQLSILEAELEQFNPQAFLAKGYSVLLKDGKPVVSVAQVERGQKLEVVLQDGRVAVVAQ